MNDYYNYNPTQSELEAFKLDKLGYSKPLVRVKLPKPTHGSLVLIEGLNRTIIKNDLPFALLNSIKRTMISNGYNYKNLKIEYGK